MIKINDYATKNHLNEWEIKELPQSDVYRLDLRNGDLSILFFLLESCIDNDKYFDNIFIPSFPTSAIETLEGVGECISSYGGGSCEFAILDTEYDKESPHIKNITPDWSKYIAKGNAVLFLNKEDANRYSNISYENFTKIIYENDTFSMQDDSLGYVKNDNVLEWNKKISIILPSIHSKNIQEISNIAKDLKENYGVEYIEVITTDCFIRNFWYKVEILKTKEEIRKEAIKKLKNKLNFNLAIDIINGDKSDFILAVRQSNTSAEEIFDLIAKTKPEVLERQIVDQIEQIDKFKTVKDIDKLITTDSTGIHEVRDAEHFQVVDCEEFFTNFLQNDKS